MGIHRDLETGQTIPASFLSAMQQFLSGMGGQITVIKSAAATITGLADSDAGGPTPVPINGLWRWRTTNHDVAITGSAGSRTVWAVCSANVFGAGSDDDTTDYNWYLAVTTGANPTGNTPAGNAIASYVSLGTFTFDGSSITAPVVPTGGVLLPGLIVPQSHGGSHDASGFDPLNPAAITTRKSWQTLLHAGIAWPAANGSTPRWFDGIRGAGVAGAGAWAAGTLPPLWSYQAADELSGYTARYRFVVRCLLDTTPSASFACGFGLKRIATGLTVDTTAHINAPALGTPPISVDFSTGILSFTSASGSVSAAATTPATPAFTDGAVYGLVFSAPPTPAANSFAFFDVQFQRSYQ